MNDIEYDMKYEVLYEHDECIITCPNCHDITIVKRNQLNCLIFRHGVFKHNFTPIDPHLSKDLCEQLLSENKIYGCSKPFQLILQNSKFYSVKCDYI